MKEQVPGVRCQVLGDCAALSCVGCSAAQVATNANEGYKTPEGREVGCQDRCRRPDRDEKQKPRELVEAMALKPGMVVADIGTGTGYMLPYLSQAVGSQGRVLAEDIFPDFLEKAETTAKQHKLGQRGSSSRARKRIPACPRTAWTSSWGSIPIITGIIRKRCWRRCIANCATGAGW